MWEMVVEAYVEKHWADRTETAIFRTTFKMERTAGGRIPSRDAILAKARPRIESQIRFTNDTMQNSPYDYGAIQGMRIVSVTYVP